MILIIIVIIMSLSLSKNQPPGSFLSRKQELPRSPGRSGSLSPLVTIMMATMIVMMAMDMMAIPMMVMTMMAMKMMTVMMNNCASEAPEY